VSINNALQYIPPDIREYEGIVETVDVVQNELDILSLLQAEIGNKFTTYAAQEKVLRELGYGYIIDLLNATSTPIANVVPFLAMLRYYKGTKRGVELALAITGLSVNAGAGFLTEWWETTGMENTTYKVRLEYKAGGNVTPAIQAAFRTFSRQYVYPILDLGTIFNGETIPYLQAIGAAHTIYYGTATALQTPIFNIGVIGAAHTNISGAASG